APPWLRSCPLPNGKLPLPLGERVRGRGLSWFNGAYLHPLQLFPFGLLEEPPDEDDREDRSRRGDAVCDSKAPVLQRGERRRYDEVRDPLGGGGNRYGDGSNAVGEHLSEQHPDDRSPRHSKEHHEKIGGDQRDGSSRARELRLPGGVQRSGAKQDGESPQRQCHTHGADKHQRLAAYTIDQADRDEGRGDVDDAGDDRYQQRALLRET